MIDFNRIFLMAIAIVFVNIVLPNQITTVTRRYNHTTSSIANSVIDNFYGFNDKISSALQEKHIELQNLENTVIHLYIKCYFNRQLDKQLEISIA